MRVTSLVILMLFAGDPNIYGNPWDGRDDERGSSVTSSGRVPPAAACGSRHPHRPGRT